MRTPCISRVGRSVLGLVAVTLVSLSSISAPSAQAEVTNKWVYPLTVAEPEAGGTNLIQLRHDGAGGIVVLYDEYGLEATTRKLLWLNENGHLITQQDVGLYAEITSVYKDRCYLAQETSPTTGEDGLRIVYRNGTFDFSVTIGEFGQVSGFEFSEPFTSEGFFVYEYYVDPAAPEVSSTRIAYYRAKKN